MASEENMEDKNQMSFKGTQLLFKETEGVQEKRKKFSSLFGGKSLIQKYREFCYAFIFF